MNHRFSFALVLVAALLVGAVGMGAATQEDPTDALPDNSTEADLLEEQTSLSLGDGTTITGWEFDGDTVRVAIRADTLTTVTIADGAAGIGERGATRVPETTTRIWSGEEIITMPVEEFAGGHVVGVSAGGASVRLSTEMDTGMALTLALSLVAAWWVLRNENSGVRKA